MPIKNPPHPGDFIRTEIIEAADLTVTAAAIASRVLRYPVCSMATPIYPGTWRSVSKKAFGVKMDTLMRMQSS